MVSFERGRRGADRAAACAFGFPKGAEGSSFSRTCFFVVKTIKINGDAGTTFVCSSLRNKLFLFGLVRLDLVGEARPSEPPPELSVIVEE